MFLCLVISLLILRTLVNLEDSVRLYRLVLMWLHLAFFSVFVVQFMAVPFGQVSFSSDFNQGVSVLFRWWRVPDFVGYILAFVAVAMPLCCGACLWEMRSCVFLIPVD
jgi:hypothetical protein